MLWLELLGWAGSVLLVVSLLQTRVLRLRVLNTAAAVLLIAFNALIGVWPMVAMNVAIVVINAVQIVRLRSATQAEGYTLLEVATDDAYLRHLLAVHEQRIRHRYPDLVYDPDTPGATAFLILRGDETAGVILLTDGDEPGTAQMLLDYVTPKYRDFTPAEFVYDRSGWFTEHGYRQVAAPAGIAGDDPYLVKVGFRRDGDRWVRPV